MDKGLTPAGNMPAPCPECQGTKRVNWTDVNGDVKEKSCPRCHGSGVEAQTTPDPARQPGGYFTK